MKRKGISIVELHVEKFVLAGALLVAAFFGAMQFIGQGNTIEIDGEQLSAKRVDEVLAQKAQDLQSQLSEDAPPTVDPPAPPQVYDWFVQKSSSSVSPPETRLASLPAYVPLIAGGAEIQANQQYVVPDLDAASQAFVQDYADALEEFVVNDMLTDDLRAELFTDQGTYDLSWTTAATVLDLQKLRDQLQARDADGEKLTIPEMWYNDRIYVWDVVQERQELVDGEWTDTTVIEPLPGMVSLREQIESDEMNVAWKNRILSWLEEEGGVNQAAIIQPAFYATKSGRWTQPVDPADAEDVQAGMEEIVELQNRIGEQERYVERLEAQLQRLREQDSDETGGGQTPGGGGTGGGSLDPGGGGGGGGGSLDPGGGDSGSGGSGRNDDGRTARENRIRALENRIEQRRTLIAELQQQLDELAAEKGIILDPEDREAEPPNLATDESVLVWAHDTLAEPGKTYRYRLTIKVYNPFYGRGAQLVPEQKDLADEVVMAVEPTEWSDPVYVRPRTRFFVTSAQADDADRQLGIGRARVQIFRLHDGRWFHEDFDVRPGDPVGAVERLRAEGDLEIDFRTNAYVVDVLQLMGARGTGPGSATTGTVIIPMPGGSLVARDPAEDESNAERMKLLAEDGMG